MTLLLALVVGVYLGALGLSLLVVAGRPAPAPPTRQQRGGTLCPRSPHLPARAKTAQTRPGRAVVG